jgi:hypothetical protein
VAAGGVREHRGKSNWLGVALFWYPPPKEDKIMSEQVSGSKSLEELMEERDAWHKRQWLAFERERSRLLAEGHKGCYAAVKDEQIVGVYPDVDAALAAGYDMFGIPASFMIGRIIPKEEERVYRAPWSKKWEF